MPRYMITVTDEDAARLESWFGGPLAIGQWAGGDTVPVAGIDGITDEEASEADVRQSYDGPLYHAGGPDRS